MRITKNKISVLRCFTVESLMALNSDGFKSPLEVSGIAYALGISKENKYKLRSLRKTIDSMIVDGLLSCSIEKREVLFISNGNDFIFNRRLRCFSITDIGMSNL